MLLGCLPSSNSLDGPIIASAFYACTEAHDHIHPYFAYNVHTDGLTSSPPLSSSRNDPTPDRGSQLPRAASLIVSSLGFIHDLRTGQLSPDTVRGTPLDMDQYHRLFGTARIPTEVRRVC